MIRGAVFDVDHTLFDRYATLCKILPEARERFALAEGVTDAQLTSAWIAADKKYVHFGWKRMFGELAKTGVFAPPAPSPEAEAPVLPEEPALPEVAEPVAPAEESGAPDEALPTLPTKRKARGFLLFLFILLAIPVTLVCIAVLLIPTLLALGIGAGALYGGVMSFISGIANFSVFADILLVIGVALVVLAVGLLFAWIFIWLLGGVIPGLVRGVCALGRKWCYKEVPAA